MRILILVLAALVALPAAAQERGLYGVLEGRQATPGGYYLNAQPGQPVTRVNVWGQVLRPGVYDVGPDFDLENVLTLAGVAAERVTDPAAPDLILRLYRSGEAEPTYVAPIREFVRDPAQPELLYGDVVELRQEGVARVAVWGSVARPGIFEVGPTISARDVLALAGGPRLDDLRPSQSRSTRVRIIRGDSALPSSELSLEEFLTSDQPALSDGDVLQVETEIEQSWSSRDTFTVVGLITSGTIAVVQFLRLIQLD